MCEYCLLADGLFKCCEMCNSFIFTAGNMDKSWLWAQRWN